MRAHPPALVFLTAIVLGCATQGVRGSTTGGGASQPITRGEMERARYASLHEVVQALRGAWLQPRGPNTLIGRQAEIQVVIDDVRMGGVEVLRTMNTANVVSIAFVNPTEAAQRWGGAFVQGAIVVTTHPDGAPPPAPPAQ